MEQCKDDKGSCAVDNSIVGMVIGGRAARACDVCGTERARWYCAADLAYLCDRCDGSVHSANAVARRHERARLGPNGAPLKTAQKLAPTTSVKRDAAAAGPFSAATLNPRKKPRSIRRHKPSSMHIASKQGISTSHTSNHINSSPSKLNASLIYASNYSIMINNPRNDLDYIANSNIELNSQFVVKAEPYSPTDMRDQVKVPDHTDDDPLFEALFDFRDLQEDDLFLHQVPIYNPLQNQDNSPTVDTKPCVVIGHEEIKPTTIITPLAEESKEPGLSKYSPCAAIPPSELSQAELDSNSSSADRDVEVKEALPIRKCEEPDRFIDSGNCLCDLDQLDFDSMLHGHDEDGDEESHASHMSAFPGHGNPDYIDASDCHITRDDSGSYAEDSCAHHGNGNMDGEDFDDNYDAVDEHAGYGGEAFDFDAMESESPRTWLSKVKVESGPDDAELHGLMQVNGAHADALLKEKLTDTQYSGLKLGLKLNFEDVLHAWSDRGTFWMDGHPPPQMNCLDFLGGWLVPDMSSTSATDGDGQQLVPVLNQKSKKGNGSAREASVLRYREKRRTRLFCKKIRYEVRKLNAEKRPRMKGRFVKRISIVV